MAKRASLPSRPDPDASLQALEQPRLNWKVIAQILGVFGILWLTALMTVPYIGYWGVGILGVLTLVAIGGGVYLWRMRSKATRIVDILKGATNDAGRKDALEKLAASDPNDAMNALARAQLLARDDIKGAIEALEAVDINKASALIQDDFRANLGLFYLMTNRVQDARNLADNIKFSQRSASDAKARALQAAVCAEAFSRTGRPDEAKKLLETYKADDPAFGEVRMLLLRASVWTFFATKNRGLAKKAMTSLAEIDPNALGPFVMKGANMELTKMAKEVLQQSGMIPQQRMKMRMR